MTAARPPVPLSLRRSLTCFLLSAAASLAEQLPPAAGLTAALEPASGVLASGALANIHFSLTPAAAAPATSAVRLRRNASAELPTAIINWVDGKASLSTTLHEPGALFASLQTTTGGGEKLTARAGFVFDPEKIRPAVPRPDDFDGFWDAELAKLALVPLDPVLDLGKTPASGIPEGIEYTQFSLAVSATERVRGQLAYPKLAGKRFPALVIFQWAGIYPLSSGTVTGNAAQGWLAVNVSAHDLPIDEPKAFYDALAAGPLKNYSNIGNDDRAKSYCLRMFLGVRRALDFVCAHPAWDGRVLVAHGTSQGGTQALVAAALDPAVTAVVANVPAYCDHNGTSAGRALPHPYWLSNTDGRDAAAVAATARYFDVAHFAPRIRVPVLVSAGLIDETCPPAGIAAMANSLTGPHELLFMPQANHKGDNATHSPYLARAKVWLDALRAGLPAPLAR
jgi:cephalosporin-C deacetylase-like acetyl esterase